MPFCPIDPSRRPRSSGGGGIDRSSGSRGGGGIELDADLPIGADLNTALMACESDLLLLWRIGLGLDKYAPTDAFCNSNQQRSLFCFSFF